MNLPSYLLKNWASAELTRLGLSCHLAGEGKVRPMAWVARSLTTAGRFATAQILFHDAAASHIPQLLHLPEDLRSLPLQCFQRICHRDLLLEYSYSRILWLGQLFVNHLQSRRTPFSSDQVARVKRRLIQCLFTDLRAFSFLDGDDHGDSEICSRYSSLSRLQSAGGIVERRIGPEVCLL